MTEEEIARQRTEWEAYGPKQEVSKLEPRHLQKFEQLEEGLIVVASGSPRGGRFLDRFSQLPAVQLSDGLAKEKLQAAMAAGRIPELYHPVAETILEFRELKKQWRVDEHGEANDGGLSLAKARMGAAAAILLQIANGEGMPERFMAIGRDYNLANCELDFLDKPEYGRASKGKPVGIPPYEQVLMLYRPVDYYRGEALFAAKAAIVAADMNRARDLLKKLATVEEYGSAELLQSLQTGEITQLIKELEREEPWLRGLHDPKKADRLAHLVDNYRDFKRTDPQPFFIANSSTLLELRLKNKTPSSEELKTLVDLSQPMPKDWISSYSSSSFMTAMPDKHITSLQERGKHLTVFSLWEYYGGLFLGAGGEGILQLPGVADWTRPPFSEHLSLWAPHWRTGDEAPITNSVNTLSHSLDNCQGYWKNYGEETRVNNKVADEMAGFPQASIKKLLDCFTS